MSEEWIMDNDNTCSPNSEMIRSVFLSSDTSKLDIAMLTMMMSELRPQLCAKIMLLPMTRITVVLPRIPIITRIM